MGSDCQVAIVGAGPYGLSIAAHLRALGIDFRIFGSAMDVWQRHMPRGMTLKSDGFASNLSDPGSSFTLKHFCAEQGIAYHDTQLPVRLDTFVSYALAFQKRFVPNLEDRMARSLDVAPGGFRMEFDNGETVNARRVVLAVGVSHFQYTPPSLAHLSPQHLSHSSAHTDPARFSGRSVSIIGRGASAIDLAVLMRESGADVTVIARHPIEFHDPPDPEPRPLWQRLRFPSSGIGPGLRSRFFTDAPVLFHRLPRGIQARLVRKHLTPAAGWFMRERFVGRVRDLEGYAPRGAEPVNGSVRLKLTGPNGEQKEHTTEHIIAATGYKVDLRRLPFLSDSLRVHIQSFDNMPALSRQFQSSVPGLYFVGVSSTGCFGPMMRFAFGSDFTARRLSRHLARVAC